MSTKNREGVLDFIHLLVYCCERDNYFFMDKSEVKIRWAFARDIKNLTRFFVAVYRPNHICTQKKHLIWFFKNPFCRGAKKQLSAVLAETTRGEIASFLGCYPAPFVVGGKRVRSAWMANWITKSEFYGKGIGQKILEKISGAYDIAVAASFSRIAYSLYQRQGWKKLGRYRRYSAVLNTTRTEALIYSVHPVETLRGFDKSSLRKVPSQSVTRHIAYTIEWVREIDVREWDRDWPAIRVRYGATVDRTAAYLQGRFFAHPFIRYHVAVARAPDRKIVGMLILRKEGTRAFTIGRIVDIVALPGYDFPLIGAAIDFAKKHGYDALDTYVTFDPLKRVFKNVGFVRAGGTSPYQYIPEFFNPLAIRPRDPLKHAILIKSNVPGMRMPKSGRWHVVKADGDRDRAY